MLVPSPAGKVLRADLPFTRVELQAMAMDGLLTHVFGSTYVRAGTRVGRDIRAEAMAHEIPSAVLDKTVIGRESAAWIYGCAPAPTRMSLLTDHTRRTTSSAPFSASVIHEVQLKDADTVSIAGAALTTPLRTARDLALYVAAPEASAAIDALAANPALACNLEEVKSTLEELVRVPRKRAALGIVNALLEHRTS